MKASVLLSFILNQHLNLENGCDHVLIDDDDEFFGSQSDFIETFFGIKPTKKVPAGEYVYMYSDTIVYDCTGEVEDFLSEADLVLEDKEYKIYLFRIED